MTEQTISMIISFVLGAVVTYALFNIRERHRIHDIWLKDQAGKSVEPFRPALMLGGKALMAIRALLDDKSLVDNDKYIKGISDIIDEYELL